MPASGESRGLVAATVHRPPAGQQPDQPASLCCPPDPASQRTAWRGTATSGRQLHLHALLALLWTPTPSLSSATGSYLDSSVSSESVVCTRTPQLDLPECHRVQFHQLSPSPGPTPQGSLQWVLGPALLPSWPAGNCLGSSFHRSQ
ncbi:hypothetical protein HJG60_008877 [Phyllostomus discolor]|uniref:Uncharacterized protein n=1 Tax=Phyllostomus discolor TaxID=89673 RepID=A0A834DI85_9CHIR|nr:hypothetical protein HJG60_008877 [Phyllostomus discolor]